MYEQQILRLVESCLGRKQNLKIKFVFAWSYLFTLLSLNATMRKLFLACQRG